MSNTVIKVENLSKQYRLGMVSTGTLSHDLNRWWHSVRGKEDPYLKIGEENDRTSVGKSDYVWSLRDVNFEVKHGEVLGIIGRNGAGKSTLLKILSRTTAPTTGSVKIKGRVASLLEVGTGFHPELSGRENIFLNGAILGMSKTEIARKFDEIVDFAGVERYIDTPVKRYSSGMYVRLAFAVAAHLEPEILIVDEVLAVGDLEFQTKCLGKMKDVSEKQGRTVLFVSHNIGVINQLCQTVLVMQNGRLNFMGKSEEAVNHYLEKMEEHRTERIEAAEILADTNHFVNIYNADNNSKQRQEFSINDDINLMVSVNVPLWNPSLELAVSVYDNLKNRVFTIHEKLVNFYTGNNILEFEISIPRNFLTPGHYSWLMCINHPGVKAYDLQDGVCDFSVVDTGSEFAVYSAYGSVFPTYSIKHK